MFDNNDPKGLGRIRVKMAWQNEKGEATPWIQVISPHGGGGKGFHFIPEKGEKVMVDFQGGNAELPYVIGNMFNTNAKSGFHTEGNDVKCIKTRSGCAITWNDQEGSIKIEDKAKSCIYLDGSGGISISTGSLTINCTTYTLNASEKATITTPDLGQTASNNYTLTSAKMTIGDGKIDIKGDVDMN